MYQRLALTIVGLSLLLSSLYYFSKIKGLEHYRLQPLSSDAAKVKYLRIQLNLATEQEFEDLPGIGPGLAKRIVEDRERNGRFETIDDLSRVKGIGDKKMAQISKYLTV